MFYEFVATPLGGSSSSTRQPPNHIVLHIVVDCIRWSTAVEILSKTPEEIIDALVIHWIKLYGKPELMIWDGEMATVSIEALQWASRNSLQLTQGANHNNVWVVERHNEILRNACYTCQT